MTFIEIAKHRFSSRHYYDRPVEEEKLLQILEAGRIAPSAANRQPWMFVVIKDPINKMALAESYKRDWLMEAPVIIVVCSDHQLSWVRPSDAKDHADIDAAIATDHMTLAATELGLASCWICAFDAKVCSRILDLPDYLEPVIILPIGYPVDKADPERHARQRKSLDEIVLWEKI